MPVEVVIIPEQLVTENIEQLIHYPGAFQVLEFADGKVRLVGVRALEGGLLVGQQIRNLTDHLPNVEARDQGDSAARHQQLLAGHRPV